MPNMNLTGCGYMYNWYAATNGTGTSSVTTDGTNVNGSICPTGFTLPRSGSVATTNDYAILNGAMYGDQGPFVASDSDHRPNWLKNGAWQGLYSGFWTTSLNSQGSEGNWWSSTARSDTHVYLLFFNINNVYPASYGYKYHGRAVRCIMEPSTPAPPASPTVDPQTQPQTADVYPTTGWGTDTIEVYNLDDSFTDPTNATISIVGGDGSGGEVSTPCTVEHSPTPDRDSIKCTLPTGTNRQTYNVMVDPDGAGIGTDIYAGKVTYFDPGRRETIGSAATTHVTFDEFNEADCNAMTQGAYGNPAPANQGQVVYLTDERNNQTYKVKKMQDGKCWIIDNLKYRGESGPGATDGDIELNNAGVNSVNGSNIPESDENWNVKRYNDPAIGYIPDEANRHCKIDDAMMPALGTLTGCGYLYNWYAATNGTGKYSDSTQNENVSGSICPADNTRFKLPKSGTADSYTLNDFAILNGKMYDGGSAFSGNRYQNWLRSGAWQGLYSGHWGGTLTNQGSSGVWWSTTSAAEADAYSLYVSANNASLASSILKYGGRAVRCVFDPNTNP
jgi:uncharacterized protein (TIGR02145 family)